MRSERPREVHDEDILGPATGSDEGMPSELVPGAREASRAKDASGETGQPVELGTDGNIDEVEQTALPLERTGTVVPEQVDRKQEKQLQKMSEKLANISAKMKGSAQEAAAMVPTGEVDRPEHQAMRALADEARELAFEADEAAREGTLRAIQALEKSDEDRIDGIVDYLRRWPTTARDLESADLESGELTVAALHLAAKDPEAFVSTMRASDCGLALDEKQAIAEEYREKNPEILGQAVEAMRLPTEYVRVLLEGSSADVRSDIFDELGIPDTGSGLTEKEMSDIEWQEMKDEKVRAFEETGRNISLEVARAFPDRVEKNREAAVMEAELHSGISSARDFGKTFTAPMSVRLEGREMPALYKAEKRELAAEKKSLKELGRPTRPGIEAGSSPSREWLAFQIDKALGMDIVPATVVRTGPEGRGSLQDWRVSENPLDAGNWRTRVDKDPKFKAELAKIALFDLITENCDRHSGNMMETPDGKLLAIDNGFIAPKPLSGIDHVRSYPLWALQGKEIPAELKEGIAQLKNAPEVIEALKNGFATALGDDGERAWKAFEDRLEQVTSRDTFPTEEELAEEGNEWHIYDKARRDHYARY